MLHYFVYKAEAFVDHSRACHRSSFDERTVGLVRPSCFCLLDPTPIACSWIEAWFGHRYSMFTTSPKGQSLHRSLQLVSPNTHREVCVLMRSVRIYFVRVHRDDVVLICRSTSPYLRPKYASKLHMKELPIRLGYNFKTYKLL